MKRWINFVLIFAVYSLVGTQIVAQNEMFFSGQSLHSYVGEQVTFPQPLVVCGHYQNQYGGYLYLSYERLRSPDDITTYGTAIYDSIVNAHATAVLTARCPSYLRADTVRLGSCITGLVATVLDSFYIQIENLTSLTPHTRPTAPPNVGDARLIICASNLEYYCPLSDSNGYGAWSNEEFERQNTKVIKGLANIAADIYALVEIQHGQAALQHIVEGLNAQTPFSYAAVADYDFQESTDSYTKVGFVYRTDKVRPIKQLAHPYAPSANAFLNQIGYYYREAVQCFEELATNERFILCNNHFKSKSGGSESNQYYNAERVTNATYLADFLTHELQNNYYEDADILIVGDLNCGTHEEPIQLFEEQGFENQLLRFAPNGYSYSYRNEVQYLDHVLASPTLAPQVTGAQPYHLNADEIYTLHYKYSTDTTMYRYADHDPIIIGLALQSAPTDSCSPIQLSETFASTFGCFLPINIAGSAFWWGYANYECAYINGYNSGANTDWLIGPTINLQNKEQATISFTHTLAYGVPTTWSEHCKILISNNFTGDLSSATWTQIPIPNWPTSNYTWVDNTILVPADFIGQPNVTIAFLYETDQSNDLPTWEVKDFEFQADCIEENDPTHIATHAAAQPRNTYCADGQIHVELANTEFVRIYNACGKCIYQGKNISHCTPTLSAGLYLICFEDGTVTKIIVP